MSRSRAMGELRRLLRIAHWAEGEGLPTREAVERARDVERVRLGRRDFVKGLAAAGAAAGLGGARALAAPPGGGALSVGIVGAGLAGLACADELARRGIDATVHEASSRAGGRCFSMGGAFPGPVEFPGQVVERGGEFIDNLHKTMLGYARRFSLEREDVTREPGEVSYFFDGARWAESVVVDEYRDLVDAMRDDLRRCSGAPTADHHNDFDVVLDNTSLAEYLVSRGAGPIVRQAVEAAYMAEYGLETDEQSCLNFLLFIHADRRSKFTPFGVFSDERWHVVGGNQQIAEGLRSGLPQPLRLGQRLRRAEKTSSGRVRLTFATAAGSVSFDYDHVVLAVPFTILREVDLRPSLGLTPETRDAIDRLGYGTNAKMMVGFDGRPWIAHGSNGTSYSDLPNHQTTWETSPSTASGSRGVLTDYSSGDRGARLDASRVRQEADRFLADLDRVYPGAAAQAARDASGRVLAHLEHWPSNPLTMGSYTCYLPGQFTTIAGNEGKPAGNVHLAGEHANSFYDWQGFMEGAALSGLQAAAEILDSI
jgi:monoamine oxidase